MAPAKSERAWWFTPRRVKAAFLIAGTFWFTWAISVGLGGGRLDATGHAVGLDFTQSYAVGLMARTGRVAQFYNPDALVAIQRDIIGPVTHAFPPFLCTPFFAFVFLPFSYLPYGVALAAWSILGLIGLFFALRMLGMDARRTMPWVLTFFPVFAAVNLGQNTLLSITLMAASYALWRHRRLVLAGLVLSLLLYKPQLVIGVVLLWGLEWRRDLKALIGFGAGGISLMAVCFGLMPEASRAYIELSKTTLPNLSSTGEAAVWLFTSVRSFFQLLMPGVGVVPAFLTLAVCAWAVAGFLRLWKAYRNNPPILFAGATLLTVVLTPHALIYEWAILVVPAVLIWKERPQDKEFLRAAFSAVWLVGFLGTFMVRIQMDLGSPILFQPGMPVLVVTLYFLWRHLMRNVPAPEELESPVPGPRELEPA